MRAAIGFIEKKWKGRYFPAPATGVIVGLVFLLISLSAWAQKVEKSHYWSSRSTASTQIPGATRVGADKCAACHDEVASNFRHAFHAQQGVECEDCHGQGSLHVEGGGDVSKIISFRQRSAREANDVCLSCHGQDERIRNWVVGAHSSNGVRCTDCHQTHAKAIRAVAESRVNLETTTPGLVTAVESLVPESKVMLQSREQANEACLGCHQSQRGQVNLPYHHPLREGKVSCQDCHDPHGGPAGNNLRTATVNPLCLSCHAQYRGPFTYQHPPVNENCLTCHTPHGSPNSNLLTISMPALCLQCHAGHHNGSGLPLADRCTDCHGSIHGTDIPSATGGAVFIDKAASSVIGPASAATRTTHVPTHSSAISPAVGALGAAFAGMPMGSFTQMMGGSSQEPAGSVLADTYTALSVTPRAYRFADISGYAGRVGEYDSLQQSVGGDVEAGFVSVSRGLSFVSRASVLTGDDYHVASQFTLGERLQAGFDIRSLFQQQDNYPFYSDIISPDIVADRSISSGSVFGVKRRFGKAYARVKVPRLPVHLFVKGDWQARVGTTQLAWYDMGGDAECSFCHFTSQFQQASYTTRNVGGGAEVNLGRVALMWEHNFSSFNDRLQFPSGLFGATLMSEEPIPGVTVPDTLPGTYFVDVPSPNQFSADTVRVNWNPSPQVVFNGHVTYARARDLFSRNAQNTFDSYTTVNWHPLDRLRVTANYGQQNLLNDFTPFFFTQFGNMSYHQHRAGLRVKYDLAKHLDVETHYERQGISRSNSSLWPQAYSPDNTDLQYVVPASFSNTVGLALRYHSGNLWSARAGYDWTGTHDPGYLTVPKSNNRIFADVTLTPVSWLTFTNDTSIIVQNAFPVIRRRNRFYVDTANATLLFRPDWNLEFGYSYQQNRLNTYMAFQNDSEVGYVLQEPFLPYSQLSQTYWAQLGSRLFNQRFGWNARVTYNSARSGMQPDLNPNDAALLGNASLIQQGLFDPVLFGQALSTGLNGDPNQGALKLASTQISQVIVPEWIGQSKVYYRLPQGFNAGLIFYYGSYRDQLNPNLNGVLRTFNFYVGRTW